MLREVLPRKQQPSGRYYLLQVSASSLSKDAKDLFLVAKLCQTKQLTPNKSLSLQSDLPALFCRLQFAFQLVSMLRRVVHREGGDGCHRLL